MMTRSQLLTDMRSVHASMVENNRRQFAQMRDQVIREDGNPDGSMALPVMAAMMRDQEEALASEIARIEAGGEIGQGTIAAQIMEAATKLRG